MSYRRPLKKIDHDYRRGDFISRQFTLMTMWMFWLVAYLTSGWSLFVLLAVLVITQARDECLRFRRTGVTYQTRRSMWKGTTPHDLAHRHLVTADGWSYLGLHSYDRRYEQ